MNRCRLAQGGKYRNAQYDNCFVDRRHRFSTKHSSDQADLFERAWH